MCLKKVFLVLILTSAYIEVIQGNCWDYGHLCLGGHGKRSYRTGITPRDRNENQQLDNNKEIGSQLLKNPNKYFLSILLDKHLIDVEGSPADIEFDTNEDPLNIYKYKLKSQKRQVARNRMFNRDHLIGPEIIGDGDMIRQNAGIWPLLKSNDDFFPPNYFLSDKNEEDGALEGQDVIMY